MFLRSSQASPKRSERSQDIFCASIPYTNSSTALLIFFLWNNNRPWAWGFCDEPRPIEHRTTRCQCRRFIPFQIAELPPSRRCDPLHPSRCLATFLPVQVTLILGGVFVAIATCVCLVPGSHCARRRELLPPMRHRRQATAPSPNTTDDHSMHLLLHHVLACAKQLQWRWQNTWRGGYYAGSNSGDGAAVNADAGARSLREIADAKVCFW